MSNSKPGAPGAIVTLIVYAIIAAGTLLGCLAAGSLAQAGGRLIGAAVFLPVLWWLIGLPAWRTLRRKD